MAGAIPKAWLWAGALAVGAVFVSSRARSEITTTFGGVLKKMSGIKGYTDHDALMQSIAAKYAIDWRLLKAHVYTESAGDPYAVDVADPSYGLGQVLCTTAGGDRDAVCTNKFPAVRGWSGMTPRRLLDPATNLDIAAQIIADNIRKQGMPRAIAVYNSWGERLSPMGGPFRNQAYVDQVSRYWSELKQVSQ